MSEPAPGDLKKSGKGDQIDIFEGGPEHVVDNDLVNDLRGAVREWRAGGYQGVSYATCDLLMHWSGQAGALPDDMRPFFAQREAVETLIWLHSAVTRGNRLRKRVERLSAWHNSEYRRTEAGTARRIPQRAESVYGAPDILEPDELGGYLREGQGLIRFCSKMATGSGKTLVMAMIVVWQTIEARHPSRRAQSGADPRSVSGFSDRFLVLCPGLTIKSRLEALDPTSCGPGRAHTLSVYEEFSLVPPKYHHLFKPRVKVLNWQALAPQDKLSVQLGGKVSSEARKLLRLRKGEGEETQQEALQRVLGRDLLGREGRPRRVVVINDEAHHCYISARKTKTGGRTRWFEILEALRSGGWLGGEIPDRSAGAATGATLGHEMPIYDFTATPWIPGGSASGADETATRFRWVVSDYPLVEAIEAGLVKVPRLPVSDDDPSARHTVWRNLWASTNTAPFSGKRQNPGPPLPGELPNEFGAALSAVHASWLKEFRRHAGSEAPPVLIVVAQEITAAEKIFDWIAGRVDPVTKEVVPGRLEELSNIDRHGRWRSPPRTLLVHSQMDDNTGALKLGDIASHCRQQLGVAKKLDAEEAITAMMDTVGKPGKPGAEIRCVVSVSKLTEGWDARTVTHIVGFRRFGTQLLCEQVTGRALRRRSYDSWRTPDHTGDGRRLLKPEYAEVVGIPFEFMPAAGRSDAAPSKHPRLTVETLPGREDLDVVWPNIDEYTWLAPSKRAVLDASQVAPFTPERIERTVTETEISGIAGARTVITVPTADMTQHQAIFTFCAHIVNRLCNPEDNLGSDLGLQRRVEVFPAIHRALRQWLAHPDIDVQDARALLHGASRERAVKALVDAISATEGRGLQTGRLREGNPFSTLDDVSFTTTRDSTLVYPIPDTGATTKKSRLSHAVCDSRLERSTAEALDHCDMVKAWVRNSPHLRWAIPYWHANTWRNYQPDFIARLTDDVTVVIEVKPPRHLDDAEESKARYARDFWTPAVASLPWPPAGLDRSWKYIVTTEPGSLHHQLANLP